MSDFVASRYVVRKDYEYGEFVIGNNGYFSVISSYGNWAYKWCGPGMEFKNFLCKLDNEYVMCKLGKQEHYNSTATLKSFEQLLKNFDIPDEKCKEVLNDVSEDYCSFDTEQDFELFYSDYIDSCIPELDYYDVAGCVVKTFGNQMEGFMKEIWPLFVAELKKELLPKESPSEGVLPLPPRDVVYKTILERSEEIQRGDKK